VTDSAMPIQKVLNGTVAGAVVVVFVWVLSTFAHVEVPADVAAALTLIFTVVVAYITPIMDRELTRFLPPAVEVSTPVVNVTETQQ
jgi:hypothetical protein